MCGCGSIGSRIVSKLLQFNPKRVRVFDHNESGQFHLQQKMNNHPALRLLLGDTRDQNRLKKAMENVDIVFHTAALKHVPLCEYNPFEAVNTNIIGTQNVIEAARECNVDACIAISTDKAVNPINTMGATKLLSEKLIINGEMGDSKTKFSCVRFGNVFNSDGSVMQIFNKQIKEGGPVTLTSNEMTRFCMSINEATDLVIKVAMITEGREIFILKMPSLRILDLAEVMIEELAPKYGHNPKNIKLDYINIRPGEKIAEELLTADEEKYAKETEDMLILKPKMNVPQYVETIDPSYKNKEKEILRSDSGVLLSKEQIRKYLKEEEII